MNIYGSKLIAALAFCTYSSLLLAADNPKQFEVQEVKPEMQKKVNQYLSDLFSDIISKPSQESLYRVTGDRSLVPTYPQTINIDGSWVISKFIFLDRDLFTVEELDLLNKTLFESGGKFRAVDGTVYDIQKAFFGYRAKVGELFKDPSNLDIKCVSSLKKIK